MNLETLQYFHYIAKYKNITNAAKHLFISQSTLSRHIMALENELGVTLFERHNKQLELTQAGRAFYKDSGSFINHMEAVIHNVQAADKGHSGILRITLPSQLYYVLSGPLEALRRQYPDVRTVLESYLFDEIPTSIQYDLYNLGLTFDFAYAKQENLECVPICTEDFSLLVPTAYVKETPRETLCSLVEELPYIMPSHVEPPFLKKLQSHLQEYTGGPKITLSSVNTSESVILNVSLGLGYGLLPSSWAKSLMGNPDIAFLSLPDLPVQCKVVLLYKPSNATELTRNFLDIMQAQLPAIS